MRPATPAPSPATRPYSVDTKVAIDINHIAGENQGATDADGYAVINAADKANGFKVSGSTDAENGQTVLIKVLDGGKEVASYSATVNNGAWSATVPANSGWITDGKAYSFSATVSDKAGNTATDVDVTRATDITPPNESTTKLVITSVAGDDVVERCRSRRSRSARKPAKRAGEFNAGDVVTIVVNGTRYTTKVAADGNFTVQVKGSDLAADGDKVVDGSITTTDAAGNTGTITATRPYSVDTKVAIDINHIAGENLGATDDNGYAVIVMQRTKPTASKYRAAPMQKKRPNRADQSAGWRQRSSELQRHRQQAAPWSRHRTGQFRLDYRWVSLELQRYCERQSRQYRHRRGCYPRHRHHPAEREHHQTRDHQRGR